MSGWARARQRVRQIPYKKTRKILLLGALISFVVWATATGLAQQQKTAFFKSENISVEARRVPTRDGISLAVLVAAPANRIEFTAKSLPLIIINPGVNNRKENHFPKAFNFAKWNCIAIAIDARGHGESGGPGTLVDKEPGDFADIVKWAMETYPQVDPDRVGLFGMSLGAANVVIGQTLLQPRATVALHPPVNFTEFLGQYSIDKLVGNLPNIQTDPAALERRSPIVRVTPENTKNLLLIHGTGDNTVLFNNSIDLYNKVGGPTRDDIQIILREGLGHGQNEGDPTTFRYALTWFRHYLWGEPLNLSTWETDIEALPLYSLDLPDMNFLEDTTLVVTIFVIACAVVYIPWGSLCPASPNLLKTQAGDYLQDVRGEKREKTFPFTRGSRPIIGVGVLAGGVILGILIWSLIAGASLLLGLVIPVLFLTIGAGGWVIGREILAYKRSLKKKPLEQINPQIQVTLNWLASLAAMGLILGGIILYTTLFNISTHATLTARPTNIWTLHFWGLFFVLFGVLVLPLLLFADLGGIRVSGTSLVDCIKDLLRVGLLTAAIFLALGGALVAGWSPVIIEGFPGPINGWLVLLLGLLGLVIPLIVGLTAYITRSVTVNAWFVAGFVAWTLAGRFFQFL